MWLKIPHRNWVLETRVSMGTCTWRRTDPRRKRKNRRRKHREEEKKEEDQNVHQHQIALFFFLLLQPDHLLRRCVLQVLFFFKSDKKQVCKTRFWFLELESYRLEIYVAKLAHGSSRTRVWKRQFSSSILSFKNSRCYFPLSFHMVVNLLYTTSSHY